MDLPPLFRDRSSTDPVGEAAAAGRAGEAPGLVLHDLAQTRMRAAILFAPEIPPEDAAVMLPLCAVGFQNALGVLAPPEVAVHLGWDGAIRLNGGTCGALSLYAGVDWLVIGLALDLWPSEGDGGHTPDRTALYAEGCGDVTPPELLSAWVRHTLSWLDTWEHDGAAPLLRDWSGLSDEIGQTVTVAGHTGTALGLDDTFALVLKSGEDTTLVPLTALRKDVP
ncbi:DUF4444 domain-containing protein [Salipiger sp. IMCC34102]|uniref:biotin/lipoate--protein ligase family protein n=1 Tax=Salipiger sp. IMCC34102 TaxID=2510647 RepID=UPI00101C2333|nr:biotin/lipoate--protein ligase family protein [Salipiger sp. IMCC34102]RYH03478.1 DUF4444 domain-containing protein [Salipiger sp. IMCC34102]